MYWHGAQEDTRRTVNKIIADRRNGHPGRDGHVIQPMFIGGS